MICDKASEIAKKIDIDVSLKTAISCADVFSKRSAYYLLTGCDRTDPNLSQEQKKLISVQKAKALLTLSVICGLTRAMLEDKSVSLKLHKDNPLDKLSSVVYGLTHTMLGKKSASNQEEDMAYNINGRVTPFRIHEALRRSKFTNEPITIDGKELEHNSVAFSLKYLLPNLSLDFKPWYNLQRYPSVALTGSIAGGIGALYGYANGISSLSPALTTASSIMAINALYTLHSKNRNVNMTSPWNSAIYMTVQLELLKRAPELLFSATSDAIPRQSGFKRKGFYHNLANYVESGAFITNTAQEPISFKPFLEKVS